MCLIIKEYVLIFKPNGIEVSTYSLFVTYFSLIALCTKIIPHYDVHTYVNPSAGIGKPASPCACL